MMREAAGPPSPPEPPGSLELEAPLHPMNIAHSAAVMDDRAMLMVAGNMMGG
jgi:hypothetical protein